MYAIDIRISEIHLIKVYIFPCAQCVRKRLSRCGAIRDRFLWKIVRNTPAIRIRVIPGKIGPAVFPEICRFSFATPRDSDQTSALFTAKLFASSEKAVKFLLGIPARALPQFAFLAVRENRLTHWIRRRKSSRRSSKSRRILHPGNFVAGCKPVGYENNRRINLCGNARAESADLVCHNLLVFSILRFAFSRDSAHPVGKSFSHTSVIRETGEDKVPERAAIWSTPMFFPETNAFSSYRSVGINSF